MYLRFKLFFITIFLLTNTFGFSANKYKWDKDNLIKKANKVKFKNASELNDVANEILEIDNSQAQVLGKYYSYLKDYLSIYNQESRENLKEVYNELKQHNLTDQMLEIDFLLILYYKIFSETEVSNRYDLLLEYITEEKYDFEKRMILEVALNQFRVELSEIESLIQESKEREWDLFKATLHRIYITRLTNVQDYDRDLIEKSFDYAKSQNEIGNINHEIYLCYKDCGLFYSRINELETAKKTYVEGVNIADQSEFSIQKAYLLRAYSFTLDNMGNKEEALSYMLESERLNQQEGNIHNIQLYNSYYANMLYFSDPKNQYKKALQIIDGVIQAESIDSYVLLEVLKRKDWILSHLVENVDYDPKIFLDNDINKEIESLRSQMKTTNAIVTNEIAQQFDINPSLSNKLVNLDLKNKLNHEKIKYQRTTLISLLALSSLLFIVIYNFWQKNKLLKVVAENSLTIKNQKEAVDSLNQKLKLALFKLRSKNTNLEEDLKKQILYTNNIKNMLNVLKGEINNMSIQDGERKRIHKIILESVDNEILDQIDFKFLSLNEKLFSKLSTLHPNITRNELDLCGLIKMNLSDKEIALAQYKEVPSVRMAKWRLKRKFEEDGVEIESLLTYLYSISHEIDLMEESELLNNN